VCPDAVLSLRTFGPMTASQETFEDFRALTAREVCERAQELEQRPRNAGESQPRAVAWRSLYREMRQASATTVEELRAKVVDMYAYRLGYGYLRHRYGRRDAFMPFEVR
jgi:hypothetical protein